MLYLLTALAMMRFALAEDNPVLDALERPDDGSDGGTLPSGGDGAEEEEEDGEEDDDTSLPALGTTYTLTRKRAKYGCNKVVPDNETDCGYVDCCWWKASKNKCKFDGNAWANADCDENYETQMDDINPDWRNIVETYM